MGLFPVGNCAGIIARVIGSTSDRNHDMKLLLIGFGVVGQGLAADFARQGCRAKAQSQFQSRQIIGVATASKGRLYRSNGLDIAALLQAAGWLAASPTVPDQPELRRGI